MEQIELIAPCHFGLEAVLKREVTDLGYTITAVEDGRVTFACGLEGICRANMFLRTAERILLKVGSFKAETFDELFERVRAIPWEAFLPADAKFWVVKASSVKSKLFSTVDIQSIVKKAAVERLRQKLGVSVLPETGAAYPIRVFLMKDVVTVTLDTSGEPLHKRGYRQLTARAPISETLAAAMIMLTPWKKDRPLADPFCGSGTIPIEAAMIAANMAPGMNRSFQAEDWKNLLSRRNWYDAVNEANDLLDDTVSVDISGSDIDKDVLRLAADNAQEAGVAHMIRFRKQPVQNWFHPGSYGMVITNPPYGMRLEEKAALPALYQSLAQRIAGQENWSAFVITPFEEVEECFGRTADKKRKIYNGMIKTYYYSFMGPKPPFTGKSAGPKRNA